MSRKYSSWASNQPLTNSDLVMRKLNTVIGNEQDQCKSTFFFLIYLEMNFNSVKNFERVEAIPHMYINVDAPPPMVSE